MSDSELDFETRAIHAGWQAGVDFRSTAPVIYPSTTYFSDDIAAMHAALAPSGTGFVYSRNGNPTVRELERALASLEETDEAVVFGSGMAAIHAAILGTGIKAGQKILAAEQLYGGTRSLIATLFHRLDFPLQTVDTSDLLSVERALSAGDVGTLIFEPLSNPLIRVSDVPGLIDLAHRHGVPAIVDNTFASPYLLRPGSLGADFVVESATKYLGGHGDVMAGVVGCSAEQAAVLTSLRTATGGVLGPFEAWLVLRGIRTLAVRVERQCRNAAELAQWLAGHPKVSRVNYPGLSDDPGHDLAAKLFPSGLFGAMLSFDTDLDAAGADRFLASLKLAKPGTSLGDVETLILHPAQASHRSLSPEQRADLGISDGLLRVSVGLESPRDLVADLGQALDEVYTPIA